MLLCYKHNVQLFMLRLITLFLFLFLIFSCRKEKNCDCPTAFEPDVKYFPGDVVYYQGQCYISIGSGRFIHPNEKFLYDGNDIWLVCE